MVAVKSLKTIADALDQESDNFLLLRFIAASMVIYGHASAISGGYAPTDIFVSLGWGEYSGAIAVDLFFVISGFLVTGSYFRRQRIIDFAWARFIRIMPAFAACLILCALVLGPLFSTHSMSDYFSSSETYSYIWKNIRLNTDLAWDLPGTFAGNPKRTTINGSIWTLPAEVRMYVWVALFGLAGAIRRRWVFNIILVGIFVFSFFRPENIPLVPVESFVRLAALFGLGGFCYINRSWIPIHGVLLLAICAAAWLFRETMFYPALFAIAEVLFVFWFGYNTPWKGFNRFGDYSYGIYLWGFPIQQTVAALAPNLPSLVNALFGFFGALTLAIASWHAIEKPALRLKGVSTALSSWGMRHIFGDRNPHSR